MAETETEAQGATESETLEASDFSALLDKEFKPKSERSKKAVEEAVRTLAEQALQYTSLISTDVMESIESMIAEIDKQLSDQINLIMHNEEFQKLEGAWRGLHHLVNNTETDEMLKIRVLNISKNEVHKTLKSYKGTAWDQSPIYKKLYEEEYGQFGGEPYGCLVGDYYFDQPLQVGDTILFEDMMHYTMVKTSMFNGVPHPAIAILHADGRFNLVKEFDYEDFKGRLS